MIITIPYNPREYQNNLHQSTAQFKVLVAHRQAGKTTCALNHLIREAALNPGKVYRYIAPTYRQAKDIVWKDPEMLFRYLPPEIIDKKNEVELTVYLKNGSLITLKGADNPDSLRGSKPKGTILDEYGDMKEDVWDKVLLPIYAVHPDSWAIFIGTPKGRNHFFKIYQRSLTTSGWSSQILKASDSGIIAPERLERFRQNMTEAAFKQEFECDFLEDATAVFKNIESRIHYETITPTPGRNYKIGVDLGKYNDFTVITAIDRHTFKVLQPERFNQIDWNLQEAKIEAAYYRHNSGLVTIDATGLGDPIYDNLSRRGISLEPFKFSELTRKQLLENLLILLESDRIKIPNYEPLINELKSFRYELTPSGKIIMKVPDTQHDDCVMSLALCVWGLSLPEREPDSGYAGNTITFNTSFT